MKKAFTFYAWFQGPKDKEPFMARVLDNTTNSWRIDNHDKTYILALEETFIREATEEEIYKHINRQNEQTQEVYSNDDCIFNYCPHPELCKTTEYGCSQL